MLANSLFWVLVGVIYFSHGTRVGTFLLRRCGVKVLRFSIGFGPVIFRWRDRHRYRVYLIVIAFRWLCQNAGCRDNACSSGSAVP